MAYLTRREFVKVAAAGMAVAGCPSLALAAPKKRKPNLIFIFADQLRAHTLGCMGNPNVFTPNLDKLASQGLLLKNAISCTPVSSPYRAQLLTGQYSHTNKVVHNDVRLPDKTVLLPEVMQKHGYSTGYIGKWHLAGYRKDPVDAKNRRGWDFWAVRNCSHAHMKPEYWLKDSKKAIRVKGWEPDIQTDLAEEFIKKNKANPFSLMVSFGPPHNPYKAPSKHLKRYTKPIPKRPNTPAMGKKAPYKQYYAMVSSLDDCVGRIMKTLDKLGLAKDTILCFTSDHGDMLGSQGHTLKQRPWEESINVPFMIRHPGTFKAGDKKDALLASVDLMPTLLSLCGLPIPKGVQGLDMAPVLTNKSKKERDDVFLFNDRHGSGGPGCAWRGIRTKEWVYAFHAKGDWILHNIKKDPYQLKNLIKDPAFSKKRNELRHRLDNLRKQLGESLSLKGKKPVPARLPA